MLFLMLLAAAQDAEADRVATIVANYRAQTRAEIPCTAPRDDGEVVVCARRDADRYRVPLVPVSSPQNSMPLRTATLIKDHGRLPCGQGAIIAQCGPGFGVAATIGFDGKVQTGGNAQMVERQLAP